METFNQLAGYAKAGINFMLVITLLVFVHELGHYWVARMFGMKVDAFAVMMGGLRQKGLESHLKKPLLSSKIVGAIYSVCAFGAILCMINSLVLPQTIFLSLLAFVLPIWIASRIGALYHYDLMTSLKPIFYSYIGAGVLLFIGTRFNVNFTFFAAIMFGASLIGLMILYYKPTGVNTEESETMGFGQVDIEGAKTEVRYRPLWARDYKGTEFSLLLLPLGGFAKIRGMHPKDDGSEVKIEHGFYSKSAFARLMVLFAGPLFSILLGVVLFFATFAIYGRPQLSNDPVIASVSPGGPAEKAGFKVDDRITSINGKPVTKFFDVVKEVRFNAGKELAFTVDRAGKVLQMTATPEHLNAETIVLDENLQPTSEMAKQAKLGFGTKAELKALSVGAAFSEAAAQPLQMGGELARLFSNPGKAKDSVSGPAGIATATSQASESGLSSIMLLAASLSISLGFMNLLPIHPLDGGQMVVAFVEMFRKKRLSMKLQASFSTIGVSLLLLLMVMVWSQDISRANKPQEDLRFESGAKLGGLERDEKKDAKTEKDTVKEPVK